MFISNNYSTINVSLNIFLLGCPSFLYTVVSQQCAASTGKVRSMRQLVQRLTFWPDDQIQSIKDKTESEEI